MSKKRAEEILRKITELNQCPVCNSDLIYEKVEKTKEEIITDIKFFGEKIKGIKEQMIKAKKDYEEISKNKNNIDLQFNDLIKQCRNLDNRIFNLSIEITSTNNHIFELSKNNKIEKTDYDLLVYKQEFEIIELQKKVDELFKKRALEFQELRKKNNSFTRRINELQSEISEQFKSYAKEYFNDQISLECQSFDNQNEIKNIYFIPKIGVIKRSKKSVSQSERVLLEYLFRLAIIELYYLKSGHRAFLMLETSEGVFDISNTNQIAKLFSKFGRDSFPVVIVTNISKRDFLKELKPKNKFNLIKFGKRLTDRQKTDLQGKLF